jgi:hypothetical protein
VCEHYAAPKGDYLYRGDVLDAVPFVSLDAEPISIETPEDAQPSFRRPEFVLEGTVEERLEYPVSCVASLERLPGVVMLRTCEANKRHSGKKVFASILIAPVRPFGSFPVDQITGRPFHELVLSGFPSDRSDEVGECFRFMVLPECGDHGMLGGGMVCFREMQPVPIMHLLDRRKITRLAIPTVGILDYRFAMYMQQSEDDDAKDSEPEGADSPIIAANKKRIAKQQERRAAQAGQAEPT